MLFLCAGRTSLAAGCKSRAMLTIAVTAEITASGNKQQQLECDEIL